MADNLELALKVKADVKKAITELDKLTREIKEQGQASDKAAAGNKKNSNALSDLAKNAKRSESAIGNQVALYRNAASALGLFAIAAQTVRAVRVADQFKQIEARVRRATQAQGDYNETWAELVDISNSGGQAINTTVALFEGINRAAPEIGATRDQVLEVTRAVQQLGVLSGASGEQMRNAMLQFSQAMAGGIVRAEEFNSIVENTPAIAEAIAKGMGLTVGQMRRAVNEGEVLSKDVFESLRKQAPEIAEQFKDAPTSIERSGQAFANNMGRVVTEIDKAVGVTKAVSVILYGWSKIVGAAADKIAELNEEESELEAKQRERAELLEEERRLQESVAAARQQAEASEAPGRILRRLEDYKRQLAEIRGQIEVANVELQLLNKRSIAEGQNLDDGPPAPRGVKPAPAGAEGDAPQDGVPRTLAAAIAAQTKANDAIAGLVNRRQALLDQLDALTQKLSGPAEVGEASSSANVFALNRLRGSAQTKIEAGDITGGLADLERAQGIVEKLAESGEVSRGYLQRQVELVRELADGLKDNDTDLTLPIKAEIADPAGAAADAYKALVAEFEKQNGITLDIELDTAQSLDQLRTLLAALQREASANPIVAEMVIRQAGGIGERFSINLNGETVEATANSPTESFVEQLHTERLKQGGGT